MKFFLIAILIFLTVSIASVQCVENADELSSYRSVLRSERVKRQWYNMGWAWTGWRCAGVNGLFLDCAGKK
uniref:Uncharacterized protein n=1 Tax=Steinernema glaseri TaxID=37863 RepID=A0A1I7ZH21_9BILA